MTPTSADRPEAPLPEASVAERLEALRRAGGLGEALALFDACPAVPVEQMLGSWRGEGARTGHPLDGVLEASGWHGKRFESTEDVHPLVFGFGTTLFSVNLALIPLSATVRVGLMVPRPLVETVGRRALRLARTSRPAARLRMMEHRGVVTATMVYDALPINDHFRRVTDDTMLGVMDRRGDERPFVFVLRRELP